MTWRGEWPPSAAESRGLPAETKGARTPNGFLAPLDTPNLPFKPLSGAFAAKRGLRGLGSVRRFAFGTLLYPEVSLRDLPRITVRGQTVQGGGVPLRKAPLRSSVDPWSTRRHCGPLAFRRATEGSRVQRKMRGSQEGDKKPFGVLSPFCPRRRATAIPAAEGGQFPSVVGYGLCRLQRRAAVSAERLTLC